ncbi:MAG TPA: hypothetical protein VII54_00145 [Gaiellaceae bacterium]
MRGSRPVVGSSRKRTWAGDERRADVQPAAHAARVRLHQSLGRVDERQTLQHLAWPPLVLAPFEVIPEPDQLEVLASGEELVDGRGLAGEPDHGPDASRLTDDVEAAD